MTLPRADVELRYATKDKGMRVARIIDRIVVEDVVRHMIEKELYRLMTGVYEGDEVNREFKDFLVRERYSVRGNPHG